MIFFSLSIDKNIITSFQRFLCKLYFFTFPYIFLEKKDYGIYGVNGKMPVCFIATNHTTGGNSGSPAIDAQGNLIGLNFDRVWEGTMSDIHYDPKICRNIMVDIRYVLFIIDKYAGAGYLLNEMKLVKWRLVTSYEWRVTNDEWRMTNDEWRIRNNN